MTNNLVFGTWAAPEMQGGVVFAGFDRRYLESGKTLVEQVHKAEFYQVVPAATIMQMGATLINVGIEVMQHTASSLQQSYYERIAKEHMLSPTDPEQAARLSAIMNGIDSHTLDLHPGDQS